MSVWKQFFHAAQEGFRSSRGFRFLLSKLDRYTIQQRLRVFSFLALALSIGGFAIAFFLFTISESSNGFRTRISGNMELLRSMQIAEKEYLHFYDPRQVEEVLSLSRKLESSIMVGFANAHSLVNLPQVLTLQKYIRDHMVSFDALVKAHGQSSLETSQMNQAMRNLMTANDGIIDALQLKQADLQMVGGVLNVDENEMLNVARECKILALSLTTKQQDFQMTGNEKKLEEFKTLQAQGGHLASVASLKELSRTLRRNDFSECSRQVEDSFTVYFQATEKLFRVMDLEKQCSKELTQSSVSVKAVADNLLGHAILMAGLSKTAGFVMAGFLVALGVAGFLLLSMSFIESINKPIQILLKAMDAIGTGDLTYPIESQGKDEFAVIMAKLKLTQEALKSLLKVIVENSLRISTSSGALNDISTSMAATAEELTAQSETVLDRGQEIEANVSTISDSAQYMSTSFSQLAGSIEAINSSLEEVAQLCQQESTLASKTNQHTQLSKDTLARLADAIRSINRFVGVIKGITEQTKLLSLNAMIEAAHAGDAGRGFAIVANEVANLAQKTENASNEIMTLVENIEKNTQAATKAVDTVHGFVAEVSRISESINRAVSDQTQSVGNITGSVRVADQAASAIAGNVKNAAGHVTEVIENIKSVTESTSQTAHDAAEVKERALDLSENVNQLNAVVNRFKIN
jgi:methyl-accepting chemotaxis protein